MSSAPRTLVAFIVAIAIAGAGAVIWAVPQVPLVAGLVAAVAVLLLEFFPAMVREKVYVSLSNVGVLVAMIYGGAPLAIVASLGSLVPFAVRAIPPRRLRTAFNAGQLAVSAAASGLVYQGLLGVFDSTFPDAWTLLAITLAAAVYSVVNFVLVAFVVALASKEPVTSTLRSVAPSTLMEIPYVGLAVLCGVILLYSTPWALVLMAIPILVARHALLSFQRLDESYDRLVRGFVKAIEVKDLYTRGHSERVSHLSVEVAAELGVPYDQRRVARYAALLHDVGKIGVPLCVINKPGPLDDEEFAEIQRHPSIGAEILRDIDFLAPAIDIVRYHHERLDGRGYPHGVAGDDLSQIVRIVTAVDAFDAMTSTRSYRRAFAVRDAVAELRRCAGAQFDPVVVEALARTVDRLGWTPTADFASQDELHGEEIPAGRLDDRGHPEIER